MATIHPGPMLVTSRERPHQWAGFADAARLWLCVILVVLGTPALASGWTDYSLKIDPQYDIVRANSMDVMLCRGQSVVLYPTHYRGVGPIYEYQVTPTHIYTRHYGRKPRNAFPGDTFNDVDLTKDFYFITVKATGMVAGPFTKAEFDARLGLGGVKASWSPVRNPNLLRPLLGAVFLLVFLATHFWPITLGAVVLVVVLFLALWVLAARRSGVS